MHWPTAGWLRRTSVISPTPVTQANNAPKDKHSEPMCQATCRCGGRNGQPPAIWHTVCRASKSRLKAKQGTGAHRWCDKPLALQQILDDKIGRHAAGLRAMTPAACTVSACRFSANARKLLRPSRRYKRSGAGNTHMGTMSYFTMQTDL